MSEGKPVKGYYQQPRVPEGALEFTEQISPGHVMEFGVPPQPPTWDEFVVACRALLEPTAAGKGYNDTGVDGKNELFEFVQNVAQGSGHALGEIVYKAVRYSRKGDPADLLKIAAWAFLAWKFGKHKV